LAGVIEVRVYYKLLTVLSFLSCYQSILSSISKVATCAHSVAQILSTFSHA